MNKPGTHFGHKVDYDGYRFDSEKEKDFYEKFLKNSKYEIDVHPSFVLLEKFTVQGDITLRQISYSPDFIVKDKQGNWKHVYDVKTGFNSYAITPGVGMRFKMFADQYGWPVEVVVPLKYSFKTKIVGTTKKYEIQKHDNLEYNF